jgi:hypothetical protein
MMKTHRTTIILIGLFFAGLMAIWGLEYAGVATDKERRLRESRLLPELVDVPEAGVRKLAIEREDERLVFERRGPGAGRWQMIEPIDAAAEPMRLETLVRNLKELRLSLDSGHVPGPEARFGLDPPVATVRLWGEPSSTPGKPDEPIATLAIGKTIRDVRYVRPGAAGPIEVADSKLLAAADSPLLDWRQKSVMGVPTFQVTSLAIKRPDTVIRAERGRTGRWRISAPIVTLAAEAKVESLLAALASLRVADGAKGFCADNVRDFAPFGLAPPAVTVELTTTRASDPPLVLEVGKTVPGHPDRVYVRQADQDDVVMVDGKALSEIPQSALSLRSRQIADIDPAIVTDIQIQTKDLTFALTKDATGWELTSPTREKADTIVARSFLNKLSALETSEFFEPKRIRDSGLSPPEMTIKIWQRAPGAAGAAAQPGPPAFDLRIGRYDAVRKSVFAQLENDEVILVLPDSILSALPKNSLAFRDHTVLKLSPAEVRKLTITRAGRTEELEPGSTGEPNRWRMKKPVAGPGDTRSITAALAVLSELRAEDIVLDSKRDLKQLGLDKPLLEIAWESDRARRLKVGAVVPHSSSYYATLDDQPYVFTLPGATLKPFEAEFRDHVVMTFPPALAERVVLHWGWPKRTVAIRHRAASPAGQLEWVDEPGFDAKGIDVSGIGPLVKALSHLETLRYLQYEGAIPAHTGLLRPRLVVEVELGKDESARKLRIGHTANGAVVFAAEGTADSGPVFVLPARSWDTLISSGERYPPFPKNVFAPTRQQLPPK